MNSRIVKRTFEALKHPKGSVERAALNLKSETSEYMPSYKYTAIIEHPETETHYAFSSSHTFRTKTEAQEYLIFRSSNPNPLKSLS